MSTEKQRDRKLGHAAEADGIEEYDNPLPNWWLGLFYGTIIWAVLYGVDYHFISHRSEIKSLAAEIADANKRWPQQTATTVSMTPEAIAAGEGIYKANCVPCHGADMKGGIGPNLLDTIWIHGGRPEDILHTITYGVPAKGMITWGPILGPQKVAQVAAYVVFRNRQATGQSTAEPAPGDTSKAAAHP
ncbi:MAG TPA: cbb3-type cytochrome c oxidase N-terminal domain-containing protein [Gemmatimonadales bacterium]|nr:cbb3-type cytochrome c oxidase N-terminal domain-containing protein [Gemmatimonadales bacterium]